VKFHRSEESTADGGTADRPRRSACLAACRSSTTGPTMKLVKKDFTKDGAGWLKLIPEVPEDIWHAYNLIAAGDTLTTTTTRKVLTMAMPCHAMPCHLCAAYAMRRQPTHPTTPPHAHTHLQVKSESSTGSVDTKKVRTNLTLKIIEVDFDTSVGVMRVSGRNIKENRSAVCVVGGGGGGGGGCTPGQFPRLHSPVCLRRVDSAV
jgi:hypothetical protein